MLRHMPPADSNPRRVSLFRNGRNQAVRIPRELELPGDEAYLWREGNRLILEPVRPAGLLDVLARLSPLDESLPDVVDVPPRPVDL